MTADSFRKSLPKGYRLDSYRIQQVIGTGGFGITYLATDTATDERVAIKEYVPLDTAKRGNDGVTVQPVDEDARPDYERGLARFAKEAETIVALDHPSVVPVRRFIRRNGTAYLIMDFQDGESLATILARDKRLDEDRLKAIIYPLLDGLQEIHRKGFIHRDIKPGNILVRKDGTPVLLDFGAARPVLLESQGKPATIVSPGYTAIEQYRRRGEEGAWTDIYSLGAVMYRAISGEHPPDALERDVEDKMEAMADIGLLRYDPAFLRAIDGALQMDHRDRPDSVEDFHAMLEGEKEPKVSGAFDDPADAPRFWKVAAALLVALGIGLAFVFWGGETEQTDGRRAGQNTGEPAVGAVFRDCEDCPLLVVVPPGQAHIAGRAGRTVDIRRPFAIGVYEVTRNQYAAFVEATGRNMSGGCALRMEGGVWQRAIDRNWRSPGFPQTALHPVVCVSWRDATAYAAWLSRETGRTYRLPSEAEWEYAARGGRTTPFAWGPSFEQARANCEGCGSAWDGRATAPVGSFDANGFQLHDVHGNVAEWTWDCWSPDIAGGPRNGAPILTGHCEKRVARGGHWADRPRDLRLDERQSFLADHRYVRLGFRLVRELD